MKKLILPIFLLAMVSCKKERTCECQSETVYTTVYNGKTTTVKETETDIGTYKGGKKQCKDYTSTGKSDRGSITYDFTKTATCKLK